MLSCDQVARELSDELDGEVPLWKKIQLRMHLAMCEKCRDVFRRLERTVDVLRNLPDVPDSEDLRDD